jgi:hypothetical protein
MHPRGPTQVAARSARASLPVQGQWRHHFRRGLLPCRRLTTETASVLVQAKARGGPSSPAVPLVPPRGERSGTWLQDQQRELALCPITLQKRAAAVSFARKQLGVPSPISSAWPRRPTTLSIDLFGLIVSATFPAGSVTGKYHERPQAYGRCDSIESRRYLSRAHNARRIRRESIHLGDLQPRWPARAPQIEEDFPNADRGSLRLDGKRGPAGVERGGRISLS